MLPSFEVHVTSPTTMQQAALFFVSSGAVLFVLCLFPTTFNLVASLLMAVTTGLVAAAEWIGAKWQGNRRM